MGDPFKVGGKVTSTKLRVDTTVGGAPPLKTTLPEATPTKQTEGFGEDPSLPSTLKNLEALRNAKRAEEERKAGHGTAPHNVRIAAGQVFADATSATKTAQLFRLLLTQASLAPGDCVTINKKLREAPGADLDTIFADVPLSTLLDRLGRTNSDWRTEALSDLAGRSDLTLQTRVNSLYTLMVAPGGPDDVDANQKAIRGLVLGVGGAELSAIKSALDASGPTTSMSDLVFESVQSNSIRAEILSHIAVEGKKTPPAAAKVSSDVDDTFYAHWVDESVPKGTVYPGMREFYAALESGPNNMTPAASDLGFLTARPEGLASITLDMLESNGVKDPLFIGNPLIHFVGDKNIAKGKTQNFTRFIEVHPERTHKWCGDSGQGDEITGRDMLAKPGFTENGGRVYIHDVCVGGKPKTSDADRAANADMHLYDTCVGAALLAFQTGDISADQMVTVAKAAITQAHAIDFQGNTAQQDRYLGWIGRDTVAVNAALAALGDARVLMP